MIPCPVRRGRIGQPWWLSPELATCARRLSKATPAATAAHAGLKMFMKFNIKSTNHGGARRRPRIIDEIHDEWCRANGYKPSSTETQDFKPQAKGSSFKPESTSSKIFLPGYKRTSPWSRVQATSINVFFLCLIWNDIWWGENLTKLCFATVVDFNSTVKKVPLEV